MKDVPTKLLEDRIAAIVARVKALAAERDALVAEVEQFRGRLDAAAEGSRRERHRDVERLERENARLRTALDGAIRTLKED